MTIIKVHICVVKLNTPCNEVLDLATNYGPDDYRSGHINYKSEVKQIAGPSSSRAATRHTPLRTQPKAVSPNSAYTPLAIAQERDPPN